MAASSDSQSWRTLYAEAMQNFILAVPAETIDGCIAGIEKSYPGKDIVIITDCRFEHAQYKVLHPQHVPLSTLDESDTEKTLYLYACGDTELGLPFAERLFDKKADIYALPYSPGNRNYGKQHKHCRDTYVEEYIKQKKIGYAKFMFHDFMAIMQSIDLTSHLDGDFVEIGCYNGSSGSIALNYMQKQNINANCYFYDLFDGFTYDEALDSSDVIWKNTHQSHGESIVRERLKSFETDDLRVSVIKKNIITEELESKNIRLANIDVDMYEAIYAALIKTAPKIVPGGIMLLQDPPHTPFLIGARVALEKFLREEIASDFMNVFVFDGQFMLIRIKDSSQR